MGYKFYIQQCDKNGVLIDGTLKDLEVDFDGLKYSKCEGIETLGSIKNIYEETYADSSKVRTYMPSKVEREATTVTLTLYFFGNNRYDTRNKFNEFISGKFLKYWDTARNRWFMFYHKEEIQVSESMWYASTPYIKCEYKLQNVYGQTFPLETL